MTKFVQRLAFLSLVGLGLFAGTAQAQKIAVVDLPTVLNGMPEVQAANKKLQDQQQVWIDSEKMMQTQYQAKLDTYSKVGETGTPEFKKKAQDDLTGLQETFQKFHQSKFGQEGELAQMQQQMLKPIYEKLQGALNSFAKKDKFDAIIQKSSTLFTSDALDVTGKFQEYLKSAK